MRQCDSIIDGVLISTPINRLCVTQREDIKPVGCQAPTLLEFAAAMFIASLINLLDWEQPETITSQLLLLCFEGEAC